MDSQNLSFSIITETDFNEISRLNSLYLPVSEGDVKWQFETYNGNYNKSIKCYDKTTNKIYGALLLANIHINQASPIGMCDLSLFNSLSNKTCINGFAFVLAPEIRNSGIDKKMLDLVKPYIKNFDLCWCGVEKNLKSHNYWKRLGFKKIFGIPEADFYALETKNI